jgi:hypothetical protein
MSDLRDAARQALEFVTSKQWGTTPYMDVRVYEDAARLRDTLRAALEQPEQAEPVAWMRPDETLCVVREVAEDEGYQPLYTHPPRREWRGLTEEEIQSVIQLEREKRFQRRPPLPLSMTELSHAIEAALRSKNHD